MDDLARRYYGIIQRKVNQENKKDMNTSNLEPKYDSQKSFYGKARVRVNGAIHTLISYNTEVAEYNKTTKTIKVYGWYSNTTARHVNEFLRQHGFEAQSKKQVEDGLILIK